MGLNCIHFPQLVGWTQTDYLYPGLASGGGGESDLAWLLRKLVNLAKVALKLETALRSGGVIYNKALAMEWNPRWKAMWKALLDSYPQWARLIPAWGDPSWDHIDDKCTMIYWSKFLQKFWVQQFWRGPGTKRRCQPMLWGHRCLHLKFVKVAFLLPFQNFLYFLLWASSFLQIRGEY